MSNFTGVYRGVIHDLTDPAKRGRARLLVPAIYGNSVSGWANPVFANSSTKVGDLAWVVFENADINRPAWLAVQPGPNLEELDARYSFLEHEHDVEDLTATGSPSNVTYLRGDNTWATPPDTNTTYSAQSQAEAENSADTTARLTTGQRLFQAVSKWAVTLANAQTIAGRKLFSTELGMTQITTPSTPPAGQNALYIKADDGLYLKDSAGTERPVWSSASPWIPYTPVWTGSTTNPVLNNGTLTGRYRWTSPDTVEYEIRQTMGSTTTYGSGQWRWSLPIPVGASYTTANSLGTCIATDIGVRAYGGLAVLSSLANSIYCWRDGGASEASFTPTTPYTWGSTDYLFISGSYQTSATWAGSNIGYSPTVLATAVHQNPDFEVPNGAVPLNWNFFWGNGTKTNTLDTTPANVRSGTRSLKVEVAASSDQRIMSSVFDVPANAVVRNSIWVKGSVANSKVSLGNFFSNSGDPEFFGSQPGLGFDEQEFTVGTEWTRIQYTKALPAAARRYRQMLSVYASNTLWFDQSETEIISGGFSDASAVPLLHVRNTAANVVTAGTVVPYVTTMIDTHAGWGAGGNTYRYTVQRDGWYRVTFQFKPSGSPGFLQHRIRKNGTAVFYPPDYVAGAFVGSSYTDLLQFAAGDLVDIFSVTGYTMQSDGTVDNNFLTIEWVRP